MDVRLILAILLGVGIAGAILFLSGGVRTPYGGCRNVKKGASMRYHKGEYVKVKAGSSVYNGPCSYSKVIGKLDNEVVCKVKSESGYSTVNPNTGVEEVFWLLGIKEMGGEYWVKEEDIKGATMIESKGNLEVNVYNSRYGQGVRISGAKITLDSREVKYTDITGNAVWVGLEPGKYKMKVEKEGYVSSEWEGEVKAGATAVAWIGLAPTDNPFVFKWGYKIDQRPDPNRYYTKLAGYVYYGSNYTQGPIYVGKMWIRDLEYLKEMYLGIQANAIMVVIKYLNDEDGVLKEWVIAPVYKNGEAKLVLKISDLIERPAGGGGSEPI